MTGVTAVCFINLWIRLTSTQQASADSVIFLICTLPLSTLHTNMMHDSFQIEEKVSLKLQMFHLEILNKCIKSMTALNIFSKISPNSCNGSFLNLYESVEADSWTVMMTRLKETRRFEEDGG